jgi:DNA-binding transcriptional ArsR family regulator
MASKKSREFVGLSDPLLDLVAGCFQALSDPTRLKILRALQDGEKSVQELVELFTCTQPNISRHLAILTQAGMVTKSKQGPYVHYRIANPRVFNLCDNVCAHVQSVLSRYEPPSKKA